MNRIYRIKKNFLAKNGNIYVFTADVICDNKETALEAARAGLVRNWKWVDKIEKPGVEYPEIEYMRLVGKRVANAPAEPGEINWKWRTV